MKRSIIFFAIATVVYLIPFFANAQTTTAPPIELSEPPPPLPPASAPSIDDEPKHSHSHGAHAHDDHSHGGHAHDDHSHGGHDDRGELGPHGGRMVELGDGSAVVELVYDRRSNSVTVYLPRDARFEHRGSSFAPGGSPLRDPVAHFDSPKCDLRSGELLDGGLHSHHRYDSIYGPAANRFGRHSHYSNCPFDRLEPAGHHH